MLSLKIHPNQMDFAKKEHISLLIPCFLNSELADFLVTHASKFRKVLLFFSGKLVEDNTMGTKNKKAEKDKH